MSLVIQALNEKAVSNVCFRAKNVCLSHVLKV